MCCWAVLGLASQLLPAHICGPPPTQDRSCLQAQGGYPFSQELAASWKSGFPPAWDVPALAATLHAAGGWQLQEATSRARIAAALCAARQAADAGAGGGAAGAGGGVGAAAAEVAQLVDFEPRPDQGHDRWAVFFTARSA